VGNTDFATGNVSAVELKDGVGGSTVALVVMADWSDPNSTHTDPQSNVWTVNRTDGTGEQARIVDRPHWWLDKESARYFEAPDHPGLNFGIGEDMTIAFAGRRYDQTGTMMLVVKRDLTTADAGWVLSMLAGRQVNYNIDDGTNDVGPGGSGPIIAQGAAFSAVGVRDTTADTVAGFADGSEWLTGEDTTTGTLANAYPVRIGRRSGALEVYYTGEVFAVAVFRRALSAADVAALHQEFLAGGAQ
jgi:hypothetical protein